MSKRVALDLSDVQYIDLSPKLLFYLVLTDLKQFLDYILNYHVN